MSVLLLALGQEEPVVAIDPGNVVPPEAKPPHCGGAADQAESARRLEGPGAAGCGPRARSQIAQMAACLIQGRIRMRQLTPVVAILCLVGGPTPASADTLRQALARAYRTNPSLTGERAALRATDEGVALARAAGRPTLGASADYQEFVVRSANSFISPERAISGNLNLNIPLYRGGSVRNATRAADARVAAGRAALRATEAELFSAVVAAYLDVIRDDVIVALNESNVRVLETNLNASRDRFEIGDLTLTDVAQSEARMLTAHGELELARAQLYASNENYLRLVGVPADGLQPPPPLAGLPESEQQALSVALARNPALASARAESMAARFDVGVAGAGRLPQVSAVANSGYNNYLGSLGGVPGRTFTQSQRSMTVGISATIPLYQGGAPAARVRQSRALLGQALERTVLIERQVVADARSAFRRYRATLSVINSAQAAVAANELAVEGVRAENTVGTRNVLDVLNAEQELLRSRVQLVTARRDSYVAGFLLLVAMGRAEAEDLALFDNGALGELVSGTGMLASDPRRELPPAAPAGPGAARAIGGPTR